MAQSVKNLPTMQETWVGFLGWEDPLEEGMAIHSSILAWRIPWTEDGPCQGYSPRSRKESDMTEWWLSTAQHKLRNMLLCFIFFLICTHTHRLFITFFGARWLAGPICPLPLQEGKSRCSCLISTAKWHSSCLHIRFLFYRLWSHCLVVLLTFHSLLISTFINILRLFDV